MLTLVENQGIPRRVLLMMAAVAGFTVANLYYSQPLLEEIRRDTQATDMAANLVTVITQVGYALGLCFIIPMGDLYPRRRILTVCMLTAALMAVLIGLSANVWAVWCASLLLGVCSVIPQLFIPLAGQYARPAHKARDMGVVLSGLLTGILASRVVSGVVGELLGWRAMFFIAAAVTLACLLVTRALMPVVRPNFSGTYPQLMRSVLHIVRTHPRIRLNAVRAAFGFGSMMTLWACLAFHLARAPFCAGPDHVGLLGAAGIAGALAAGRMGAYVPRFGVRRFSLGGALLQLAGWCVAWAAGHTYTGLVAAIILVDIGLQCQQLSNQSACIQEMPEAANRANTIFMTAYFCGGSLGTFCAGLGWERAGWAGVCVVGAALAAVSLSITVLDACCRGRRLVWGRR